MAVLIRTSFTTLYVLLFTLLSIEVMASTNLAPTALAVTTSTKEDTKKSITLKGSDPEKKKLTYAIVTQPANGTVTLKGNIATYTPTLNYASGSTSPDSFTFKVNDGSIDSAPATVYIAVKPVNDKPVAQGGSIAAVKNITREIVLSGSDVDGDTLTHIPVKKSKQGGVIETRLGGFITYTPKKDYVGTDSFTFTVKDSQKAVSTAATINVTVAAKTNTAPIANAGGDQIVTEGTLVNFNGMGTDIDSDTLNYTWGQTNGAPLVAIKNALTATASFVAPSVESDTTLTFTLTVNDGNGGTMTDSVTVVVQDDQVVRPTPTGKLNDTGITQCGDYAFDSSGHTPDGHTHSNQQDCNLLSDTENDPIPAGQDGYTGRDATHNDNSDGHAGFSFTKLDKFGKPLADQSADYATTQWACVKDNVTGLIWEVKTDDYTLHDKDWEYTWYEPDNTKNGGGSAGTRNGGTCRGSTECDTLSYVQTVNTMGWCGANTWRLPTADELTGIATFAPGSYVFNADYFPNQVPQAWSSSPAAVDDGDYAWYVTVDGLQGFDNKSSPQYGTWLVNDKP